MDDGEHRSSEPASVLGTTRCQKVNQGLLNSDPPRVPVPESVLEFRPAGDLFQFGGAADQPANQALLPGPTIDKGAVNTQY